MGLDLSLDTFSIRRNDSSTPDEVELDSGHGAVVFEHGPQTRIQRRPVRAIASMTWEEGPDRIYGGVENISPDGCMVKTEASLEEGTEVELEVATSGGDARLEVEATAVVRHQTTRDGRRAYGLEFTEVDDEALDQLRALYNRAGEGAT